MSYKIKSIPYFEKELKRLNKKFPSLKNEYNALLVSLSTSPNQGDPLGKNCFKIRISISEPEL